MSALQNQKARNKNSEWFKWSTSILHTDRRKSNEYGTYRWYIFRYILIPEILVIWLYTFHNVTYTLVRKVGDLYTSSLSCADLATCSLWLPDVDGHNSYGNLPGSLWIPSLDSMWLCPAFLGSSAALGRLALGECCTRVVHSSWGALLWLLLCWQVLWQLPCLECFSGVTAVVPQWWHSAPRVTYEGSVCEDWRSSVLALANNEFSSRQFLSSVHTCNFCKCSVGVLMTVMCSEQTCEYLTLILSAVNLVVFY